MRMQEQSTEFPFPVFARASFGVLGANVPAVLRALVACGWFGINAWIGGGGHKCDGRRSGSLVADVRPRRVDLLWRLLAAARHRHHARHPDAQVSAGGDRALPVGYRRGAARVGRCESGRLRHHAGGAVQVPDVRRIFPLLYSVADERRGILGDRGAEHSGFHALCAQPARASGRPGAGLADNHDALFLHRHCRHVGNRDYFRPGDLGSRASPGAPGKSTRGRHRDGGVAARHAKRQRRCKSGLAVERFLESLARG